MVHAREKSIRRHMPAFRPLTIPNTASALLFLRFVWIICVFAYCVNRYFYAHALPFPAAGPRAGEKTPPRGSAPDPPASSGRPYPIPIDSAYARAACSVAKYSARTEKLSEPEYAHAPFSAGSTLSASIVCPFANAIVTGFGR